MFRLNEIQIMQLEILLLAELADKYQIDFAYKNSNVAVNHKDKLITANWIDIKELNYQEVIVPFKEQFFKKFSPEIMGDERCLKPILHNESRLVKELFGVAIQFKQMPEQVLVKNIKMLSENVNLPFYIFDESSRFEFVSLIDK